MNLELVKNQVSIESPAADSETVNSVAGEISKSAVKAACRFKFNGETQNQILHKTIDSLMSTGWTFELARVAASFAMTRI